MHLSEDARASYGFLFARRLHSAKPSSISCCGDVCEKIFLFASHLLHTVRTAFVFHNRSMTLWHKRRPKHSFLKIHLLVIEPIREYRCRYECCVCKYFSTTKHVVCTGIPVPVDLEIYLPVLVKPTGTGKKVPNAVPVGILGQCTSTGTGTTCWID